MRRLLAFLLVLLPAAAAWADCPRIVSQAPYITRALDWLGAGRCIVGVSRYDARDLPQTGGVLDPDADAIAALDPELMITADWTPKDVWQAAAPTGARALRVGGFGSMAEAEAMLRTVGRAAGVADTDRRVDRFAADWRTAAAGVGGNGRRALLISACGGAPYSYGRQTLLYDLFSHAGFRVVESHDSIRPIQAGEPVATVGELVDATRPDVVFVFEHRQAETCNAVIGRQPARIVALDEDSFIHPGPGLIEALGQLREALTRP